MNNQALLKKYLDLSPENKTKFLKAFFFSSQKSEEDKAKLLRLIVEHESDPVYKAGAAKLLKNTELNLENIRRTKADGPSEMEEPLDGPVTKIVNTSNSDAKFLRLKEILESGSKDLKLKAVEAILKVGEPKYLSLIVHNINKELDNDVLGLMLSVIEQYGDDSYTEVVAPLLRTYP